MTFAFRPAMTFTGSAGLFVSLTGGTNSGKTFSALRLARGIAGADGKIAVLDTEGGRTLHLKREFMFDVNVMEPPFHPDRFAAAAKDAEIGGYACLLIDSFSMEWVGIGGVLDWQAQELEDAVARALERGDRRPEWKIREAAKMASWIKPKTAHKAMVYSFLQRRMPIVFAIRGEETIKPGEAGEKPSKIFKSICNSQFPFEVTLSFRLAADRKGYVDLSDPKSWKMEGAHQAIFKDGDRISEDHGRALAEWARGAAQPATTLASTGPDIAALLAEGDMAAERGMDMLKAFWERVKPHRSALGGIAKRDAWIAIAKAADQAAAEVDDDIPAEAGTEPAATAAQEVADSPVIQGAGGYDALAPGPADTFPGDEPPAPQPIDPLAIARGRGEEAKRKGMSRKALPPEYRARERKAEADAWLDGFDNEGAAA